MKTFLSASVIGVLTIIHSTIGNAQSPVSSNKTFADYYAMKADAGPTYIYGPYDVPAKSYTLWIASDAVGDFLGRGARQILLGGGTSNAVGEWVQRPVRLLVSGRDGTFTDAGNLMPDAPTPYGTRSMVAADFNRDGKTDVFLGNTGIDLSPFSGERNSLLMSSPAGRLMNATSTLPDTLGYTHTAAAGALAGDGIIDIYVGNLCCAETPYFLINDGKGNFVKDYSRLPKELQLPRAGLTNQYTSAALVDVNGDGFPDLILGAESSAGTSSRIYLNDRHGSFANSNPVSLPPGCFDTGDTHITSTIAITAGDLRHSGQMDVVLTETSNYQDACIQILINDGNGNFTDQTTVRGGNVLSQVGGGRWYSWTFIIDVNGDGYPDLVLAPFSSTPQTPNLVLLNEGSGFFTSTPVDFFPINRGQGGAVKPASYLIPVDVRGDGKIGFVQPYQFFSQTKETEWKFAVYEPVASLPTPPPAARKFVPVAVTSSPPGLSFTVAGSGCAPGTYTTPANLLWSANISCTVLFNTPQLVGRTRYVFASSALSGGAAEATNPRTVNSGGAGFSVDATFTPQALAPPIQQSVLKFSGAAGVAFTQAISVGASFTMECWGSLDAASPYAVIMGKPNNPRGTDPFMNYIIGLDQPGTSLALVQTTGQAGTYRQITAPFTVALHTWTHVAAVLDSGTMRLYINGQTVASGPSPGPPAGQAVPFGLGGAIPDGTHPCCTFAGSMRQARVWSRALSAQEMETYATQVLTGSENGLLADWPLNDGAGQTAKDIGPNHATLTFLGSPSWTAATVPPTVPAITSANTPGGFPDVAQNGWIEIRGANLAPATVGPIGMPWDNAHEFAYGQMPSSLAGVSVTINGRPAFVYYISASQLNVLSPLDSTTGPVEVVVTSGGASSAPFTVNMRAAAPSFPLVGTTQYVVATHADYSLVGPAALSRPGYPFAPARPGETIVLYGFGFGLSTTALVIGSSSQSGALPPPPAGPSCGLAWDGDVRGGYQSGTVPVECHRSERSSEWRQFAGL